VFNLQVLNIFLAFVDVLLKYYLVLVPKYVVVVPLLLIYLKHCFVLSSNIRIIEGEER